MKKVLSYICICVLQFSSTAYANGSEDIYNEVSEIATALVTSDNIEELLGEAVILMIENDVLNQLTEKGKFVRAETLKASADEALDASANDAENAREKAISFCNNLMLAISVITTEESILSYEIVLTDDVNAGPYYPVDECEHYALTVVNNAPYNAPMTVRVGFIKEDPNGTDYNIDGTKYSRVGYTATTLHNTSATTATAYLRVMNADDNVYNFTTPKGCEYVIVTIYDVPDGVTVTSATLEKTNEVINNGALFKGKGTSASSRAYAWNINNTTSYDTKGYIDMTAASGTNVSQAFLLKENTTYRVSFKYAQSTTVVRIYNRPGLYFDHMAASSDTSLPNGNVSWHNATNLANGAEPASAEDWTEYVAYFTTGEGNTNDPEGLLNYKILPRGYETTSGKTHTCYDDISIQEVDEDTYLWYTTSEGVGASDKSKAGKIRYRYTQDEADKTQKLIHVTYDETDAISNVAVVEVGEGLAVGESANYDITLNKSAASSKIFLWDGTTLEPMMLPIEDYVIAD